MTPPVNRHLYKWSKGRIFNSYFFNKWEMWDWLSVDARIRKHLPYTEKAESLEQVKKMVKRFPSVYMKPVKGSEGRRILQLEQHQDGIRITDDRKEKTIVSNLEDYERLLKRLKSTRPYLIQQGVPTKYGSRNIDFRIYMQKNEKKQWKSSGITARISEPDSIITNLRHLDYWVDGREALKQIYKLSEQKASIQEKKIVKYLQKSLFEAG